MGEISPVELVIIHIPHPVENFRENNILIYGAVCNYIAGPLHRMIMFLKSVPEKKSLRSEGISGGLTV